MQRIRTNLTVDTGAFILIALMLLLLPLQWISAAIFAAVIHELFHYCSLRLLGVHVNRVEIGPSGAVMDVEAMPPYKELICALAGPVGGISLLLFSRWIPRVVVFSAIQSFYNLLPVYPLDGGRAIRSLIRILVPQNEAKICDVIQICSLVCISVVAIFACFWLRIGILPLLFAAGLWAKTKIHLAKRLF